MKQEQIEMQLWEYIDGTCSDADARRISLLIATEKEWQAKYWELLSFNEQVAGSIEAAQPAMRFTKNVMDAIHTTKPASATKHYINQGIIRGIAAMFILSIVIILGYAVANAQHNAAGGKPVANFNLDTFFNEAFVNGFIMVNIVVGLLFADTLFRRKIKRRPKQSAG